MSLLTDYMKDNIKKFRERLYDTQVEVRTVTSVLSSGDAYGRTASPTYTSANINAQVAWGNRYGYNNSEGGITAYADAMLITSLDNITVLAIPKTYVIIESNKYSIDRIEKYTDSNELVVHCNKMA